MPGGAELRVVFWELTARCNLHCVHCRAEAQDQARPDELDLAALLRIARDIREAADPLLILTGGEPLVRADFFDLAAACTRQFSRVALATNGTLIDDALARRIVAAGIGRVSISLDGSTPATHDAFRGRAGSFATALAGFDALRRAGAAVQINTTVTRRNEAELGAVLELALARGAAAVHVFLLVPVGCGAEIDPADRLGPAETERTLAWLFARSAELADRLPIRLTCAPHYQRVARQVGRRSGPAAASPAGPAPGSGGHPGGAPSSRGCLAGQTVCFVSRTGEVQPCGYLPVSAGNVLETRFADLWQDSELFAALRDPRRLRGKCGACGFKTVCGGCRARAFAASGDFLGEEPECSYQPTAAG